METPFFGCQSSMPSPWWPLCTPPTPCGRPWSLPRRGAGNFIPDPLSGGIDQVPGFLNPVSGVSPILLVENRDKHSREREKNSHFATADPMKHAGTGQPPSIEPPNM